jgi:hypothetical protein
MKRKLAIAFVLIFLAGCATTASYKADIYNSMQTIAEAYNASLGTFKDLNTAGQLTPEQYLRGRDLFLEFYDKYIEAIDLIIAWEKGGGDPTTVEGALAVLKAYNAKIKDYLAEQLRKGGKS